jgi:hypothetical protein
MLYKIEMSIDRISSIVHSQWHLRYNAVAQQRSLYYAVRKEIYRKSNSHAQMTCSLLLSLPKAKPGILLTTAMWQIVPRWP